MYLRLIYDILSKGWEKGRKEIHKEIEKQIFGK